jgi:hypothetical protein
MDVGHTNKINESKWNNFMARVDLLSGTILLIYVKKISTSYELHFSVVLLLVA